MNGASSPSAAAVPAAGDTSIQLSTAIAENPAPDLRVLIVADAASTRFGGEAVLPWHYFRLLRRRGVETWMTVHSRTRNELRELLPPEEIERIEFIEDNWRHRFWLRLARRGPALFGNLLVMLVKFETHRLQRRLAKELIARRGITIVHQPTPVSPKEPSLLYGLGVPVVIGPMNGGMEYPPGFYKNQGRMARIATRAIRGLSHAINRLVPGKIRAETLLTANARTRAALPAGVRGEVVDLVENGVETALWTGVERPAEHGGSIRFVFMGRLVDWKAVDILLEAFQRIFRQLPCQLEILGDGPMRAAWERAAQELGLGNSVVFHGWKTQAEAAEVLRAAHVLVLSSLFECGGAVVLEAMAAGIPVIATAWGGPADYLDETCGRLIAPTSRTALVDGFARAMLELGLAPDLRVELGRNGRERVRRHFDWERKVDQILEVYRNTIGRSAAE